jgi:hypothetical protein
MLNIQSPLSGIRSPFGRRGGFSPAVLFANNEPGVWYDPSDLATLFQDTAGTTPVTTPGQTVALMLDKSKGLTLGPELVTNGTFDTADVWSLPAGSQISGGVLSVSTAVAGEIVGQAIEITAGKTYQITYTVISTNGQILVPRLSSNSASSAPVTTTTGTFTALVLAVSNTDRFAFNVGGTGITCTIDNISVKELPGNHATQPTAAARPTYQNDGTYHWLSFDGVDDWMVTPTITPAIDKAQVFAGVRKLSDATGMIVETSLSTGSNNGTFNLYTFTTPSNVFTSRGTVAYSAVAASTPAPSTIVLSGLGDISGDRATLRVDGTQVAQNSIDQGPGNYLAYPMYIGRRAGTSFPFNGQLYSLITRFGANLEVAQIESTEAYVAGKTAGVDL